MDVLVVLGTSAAWTYGFAKIWMGHSTAGQHEGHDEIMHESHDMKMEILMHTHFFEMSATLIVVIMFGKLLEAISKK
jgi:cation transport ATPase